MSVGSFLPLTFAALLAAAPADAIELHTERSLYRNIVVYDDDGMRCMKFGRHAAGRQTCMSLADRDRLVFDYTRMMMAALYLNPSPQRVLIIGEIAVAITLVAGAGWVVKSFANLQAIDPGFDFIKMGAPT